MRERPNKASIIVIGAGAIVKSAHLPAYRLAGYEVRGIYDLNPEKSSALAREFGIERVYPELAEALSDRTEGVVFDLAVPASQMTPILSAIPNGARVLLQKPMGETIEEAREIVRICSVKRLVAAVNFQLRYAPYILKAKELIAEGVIGTITDVEIRMNIHTPWQIWDFLADIPRMEILYHSIHYIDLIRKILGEPVSMRARTIKHPSMCSLASVRTNICMDYGDHLWGNILTNHCHDYGGKHQQSHLKVEGTKGAILVRIGRLLNYPHGAPDVFQYIVRDGAEPAEWRTEEIEGTWFPHAFIGSMAEVMRTFSDPGYIPDNHVSDCLHTMACVEAAYRSNEQPGVSPDTFIQTEDT